MHKTCWFAVVCWFRVLQPPADSAFCRLYALLCLGGVQTSCTLAWPTPFHSLPRLAGILLLCPLSN